MNRIVVYLVLALCLTPFALMILMPSVVERGLAIIQAHLLVASIAPIYFNAFFVAISYKDGPARFRRPIVALAILVSLATLIWFYLNMSLQNLIIASLVPVSYRVVTLAAHEYERHGRAQG
ncbi:MAG TPA: hypothetical protein VE935_18795 [Burkholderiales bacterium]|nr:hypothetical protein [Burkholderiales bacterium]